MIGLISRIFYRMVGGNTTIPVTLGIRNIYIFPTRYGLLYLSCLTAMLIGSINYNNNLGFLLTFLLGSLGLTAMLHTYGMLWRMRLTAAVAAPVFAGDSMDVEIVVGNIDRPRTALCWFFNPDHSVCTNLSPDGPVRIRVPAVTAGRGWFSPPRLRIACDYPLGLFRAWARIDTDIREVVYPKPMNGPAPRVQCLGDRGAGGSLTVMGNDDFLGLSAYQPGDPQQRIHWQAYSRGRGLYIKQFAGQASTGIVLDMQQINAREVEKKLSILCFHVLRIHRQGLPYGLKLSSQVILPACGRTHRDRCLRVLALFQRH
jgi:uncharacterized protein (DUF58 family)